MKKAEMKQKIKKITADKRFKLALIIAAGVIVLLLLIRLFLLVIPVSGFEIEGETFYSDQDIINAADIRLGTPIYGINKGEAEKKILKECPHIEKIEIKQSLYGTLYFVVKEKVPGWYVQVHNMFYALDYDMKVIHETYDEESLQKRGITKIVLPELQSAVVGEMPTFGNGDKLLIEETLKIIDSVRTHSIKKSMTSIDLENRFEIKFTVSETYDVVFGDMKNADEKFERVLDRISSHKQEGGYGGEINVINPNAVAFKPYFDNTVPENSTETSEEDSSN